MVKKTNIYFIKSNEAIKIGKSDNVPRRLKELQTSNHSSLEILYVIENEEETLEKHTHGICERYHVKGEWFSLTVLDHLLNIPWYKDHMKKIK